MTTRMIFVFNYIANKSRLFYSVINLVLLPASTDSMHDQSTRGRNKQITSKEVILGNKERSLSSILSHLILSYLTSSQLTSFHLS